MVIYSIFTSILFFVFALLQLNDPDPYLWFPLYFAVTCLATVRIWRPLPKLWIWLSIVSFFVMAIYFSTLIPYWGFAVEEVRETLGLLLAALFTYGLSFPKQKLPTIEN